MNNDRRYIEREHIVWAYRLMLDRDPESESVISSKLNAFKTTQELRRDFINSREFLNNNQEFSYRSQSNIVIKELDEQLRLFLDLSCEIGVNISRGNYEQSEIDFVRQIVKPGQTVLDIGANIGFYAITMASLVGSSGIVYAFEPLNQNADLLKRSIAENKFENRVILERVVLGQSSTSAKLVFLNLESGAPHSGGAYLLKEGIEIPLTHEIENVEMVALDEYPLHRQVSFIKVDVEGAEPLVFRGARKILEMDRPIILSELHPVQLEKVSGCTPAQFISEMQIYGYDCHILSNGQLVSKINDVSDSGVISVVFWPKTG